MPTYTYECDKCGHSFDVFHGMSATPEIACEACGSKKVKKLIGTGGGIIFKGSGFYQTDFKTKTGTAPAAESSTSTESKHGCGSGSCGCSSKSDSKAAPKTESKTPSKAPAKSEK